MAMVKCRECGKEVSSQAKACPNCGIKDPAPRTSLAKVFSIIGMILVAIVVFKCSFGVGESIDKATNPRNDNFTPPGASSTTPVPAPLPPPLARQWRYSDEVDTMRKRSTKTAETTSLEELEFPFPYNKKPNYATLGLISKADGSKFAYLSIDHGQFLCHTYDCPVNMQVDGQPVKRLTGSAEGSGRADTIILPYGPTLALLKKGQVLTVEANFFQQGSRQMLFKIEALDWKP